MSLPVFFYHTSNSSYLKYSLKQAKYYNPDSTIYLLGDDSNNCYPFVNHVNVADFKAGSQAFASVYKHLSHSGYKYELMCFARWFCIRDFCRQKQIESFIYLDSDVLAFAHLSTIVPFFGDAAIANPGEYGDSPAFTYFRDFKALDDFCNYLTHSYTDSISRHKLDDSYTDYCTHNNEGGICDMTLFNFYFRENPGLFKIISLINDQLAIDNNINNAEGYELKGGGKKIYWKNHLPYCKQLSTGRYIQFVCLHYQAGAKKLMYRHFNGGGYLIKRAKEFLLEKLRPVLKLINSFRS
ncbi:hypothetical protein [Mucilaginibacter sp.]|uniref:hypothetical protein n=1 Tax=Mucilaginibacter sp. TaxID=1882438 RepID=UPI003D0C014C